MNQPTSLVQASHASMTGLTVTSEQLTLIKKTIAKDATATELELYLYDCRRRGVHPLDKLLHFTKRGGKYTPVVAIDFMRSRAAETGESAGADDAIFVGLPRTDDFAASVTVYRLVQGTRCAWTATARWSEYKPDQDFMWRKMPHVMLSKCAEALALRKAFPQELHGLYERAELDQAEADLVDVRTGEVLDAQPAAPAREREPGEDDLASELPPAPAPPVRLITQPQQKRLFAIATNAGWSYDQIKRELLARWQLDSTAKIPILQYDQIIGAFKVPPATADPSDIPF